MGSRKQHVGRSAYRVISGQPGVSQRCHGLGVSSLIEFDDGAAVRLHLLGHAAVSVEAREGRVFAVRILAHPARRTQPAAGEWMHDDRVAGCNIGYSTADLTHPAGVFMPEVIWQFRSLELLPLTLDHVEVGAA